MCPNQSELSVKFESKISDVVVCFGSMAKTANVVVWIRKFVAYMLVIGNTAYLNSVLDIRKNPFVSQNGLDF